MNKGLSTKKFINPYHFVNLPSEKKVYEEKDEQRFTGKIRVRIETKSPLFIPNTSCDDVFKKKTDPNPKKREKKQEKHKSYDFFSYNNLDSDVNYQNQYFEPVLPGSEIRGMLRSVYETLTGSCLSAVDDDKPLYKRTSDYYSIGLIGKEKDKGFVLYPAKNLKIDKRDILEDWKEGQKVTYNGITGYLIKGEPGPEMKNKEKMKHNGKIVYSPDLDKKIPLDEKYINGLERVLNTYQDSKINKNLAEKKGKGTCKYLEKHYGYQEYKEKWDIFRENGKEYFPVYYSKVGKNLIYLSPACITKEAYKNQLSSILKAQGNFQTCTHVNELCPACSLFGMVGAKNAKASSLRFSDAIVDDNRNVDEYYDEIITLEELASPKATASEFYLQKEEGASFWTYDYYVKDGKIVIYTPKIAGRKFYWHHMDVQLPQGVNKTERNKTVRPLKSNVPFKEDIYFDEITKTQLEQLLYICNISSDDTAGYKLGAGKPLGLGSVSMKVEDVKIRMIDIEDGTICYKEEPYEELPEKVDYERIGFSKEVRQSFELMTRFDATEGYKVTYPVTEQQLAQLLSEKDPSNEKDPTMEEGFRWFSTNKGGRLQSRSKTVLKENMKYPLSANNMTLTALHEEKQKNNGNRNGGNRNNGNYNSRNHQNSKKFK